MQGLVTDIQRFSLHDGPGIRTTVFLKGCPLRCAWCQNPETLRPEPEVRFDAARCILCGACVAACPRGAHALADGRHLFRRSECIACGACVRACWPQALELVGRRMEAEAVLAEVLEDRPFYDRSGGGVTLSGGEPLAQPAFARELLARARAAGVHTALDTSLAARWEDVEAALPVTDLWLVDLKAMDDAAHRRWTGASNAQVLTNAARLGRSGAAIVVRTPVVPGVSDSAEAIGAIADFIAAWPGLRGYELLPYHPLGEGKYAALGLARRPALAPARAETMAALVTEARRRGVAGRPVGGGVREAKR